MSYTPAICKDCQTEIFVDVNMVIIKNDLWKSICDTHEDLLCDCCMEKRLGRPIEIQDFKTPTMGVEFMGVEMILCNAMWLSYKNREISS